MCKTINSHHSPLQWLLSALQTLPTVSTVAVATKTADSENKGQLGEEEYGTPTAE